MDLTVDYDLAIVKRFWVHSQRMGWPCVAPNSILHQAVQLIAPARNHQASNTAHRQDVDR